MSIVLTAFLAILADIAPVVSTSSAILKIISLLETLIPALINEYQSLKPIVLNIITAFKGNDNITEDQWNQLDAMEQKLDADFDKAATAAQSEN